LAGEAERLYAGRWVAKVRGRVVAQGGTPGQVRRAAQSRFKETPEIIFIPMSHPIPSFPILDRVRAALPEGLRVYLVGGAVRDILLQRETHDLDFTLERGAIKLARRLADALGAGFFPLDSDRDTGRVIVTDEDGKRTFLDFAAFRGTDLEADLAGRDFTLNAMALDMADNSLHDPLGGAADLQAKKLRLCSPSSISDDPVRILRGVRLAAAYGFKFEPEVRQKMKAAASDLTNISMERLRDELLRILEGPQPATCLRVLDRLGALSGVLPEVMQLKGVEQRPPHVHTVWEHTLAVLDHLESLLVALDPAFNIDKAADWYNGLLVLRLGRYRQALGEHLSSELIPGRSLRSLLFLAAIYHDIAKPQSKSVDETGLAHFYNHDQLGAEVLSRRARALALGNDEIKRLDALVRDHMRIHNLTNRLMAEKTPPSRRAIYRFFHQNGPAGVDICLLTLADVRATYEQTLPQDLWAACLDVVRMLLEAWYDRPVEAVSPPPLLDGNDLMRELKLKPGPLLGKLLEAIREAQAAGEVTTRAEALALARKRLGEKK
jgi:tRNA nucleotidyltransferase/poly(A) polymerase